MGRGFQFRSALDPPRPRFWVIIATPWAYVEVAELGPPAEALSAVQKDHSLGASGPVMVPCETATSETTKSGLGLAILADD